MLNAIRRNIASLISLLNQTFEQYEVTMRRFALLVPVIIGMLVVSNAAQAQWVRRYYRPAVVVAPQPVMRVSSAPVVMYRPTTIVTTRQRPILGGTVTHVRRGYQRSVVW